MKKLSIIGIDIAKEVFQVCVMDEHGNVAQNKRVRRGRLVDFVMNIPCKVVAMEACGGSQYWGRKFQELGYEVRLIAAQYVKPFVKSQKNDRVDAEAICEAALRPQMRFVSVRSRDQQDLQNLHRIREGLVRERTAKANRIRGLLLEYGIIVPRRVKVLLDRLPEIFEQQFEKQSGLWFEALTAEYDDLFRLHLRIRKLERRLTQLAKQHPVCQRIMEIPGVGYLTASATVAAIGDPRDFKTGRQFAAALGLVPQQRSSGGKTVLGHITKRGNSYLRKLFVHGARAAMAVRSRKATRTNQWAEQVFQRRGHNRAVVALANKNARTVWALMVGNKRYCEAPDSVATVAA